MFQKYSIFFQSCLFSLISLSVFSTNINSEFLTLIQGQSWKNYIITLSFYHKFYPGLYTPPDLIRFDRFPLDELAKFVNITEKEWKDTYKLRGEEKKSQQLLVSKKANEDLDKLLKSYLKKLELHGSHAKILESIYENQRLALTPLDATFKISDLGKKIFDQSKANNVQTWDSFTLDSKNQVIKLENSNTNQSYIIGPKLKVEDRVVLRTVLKPSNNSTLPDITLDTRFLGGNYYGSADKNPYPFGNYVQKDSIFVDEQGHQHFEGDGHKHNHGHNHKH